MNRNMIAVAVASLLVGGVAVASYNSFRAEPTPAAAGFTTAAPAAGTALASDAAAPTAVAVEPAALQQPAPAAGVEYADVVDVDAVRESRPRYAAVIATDPVRETSTTSTPREVCEDVVVQDRLPERDGNVGGTVAGAVIGGLLGNQVGGGNGRKAATAAGAVAGGFIGNRVDRNHVGGRVVSRTERQCHTEQSTSSSSRVVGYNVTYRNADGTTGSMRMDSRPGSRVRLGTDKEVVGYDVTYRYHGAERTVRLDQRPGERLPVVDGQVVLRTASAGTPPTRG